MRILDGMALAVGLVLAVQCGMAAEGGALVKIDADGKLVYDADARGNRIPDFSRAGYMGGGVAIPEPPVTITLSPDAGDADDTARIQKAIDELSTRPLDKTGHRGVLLLKRGTYRVSGTIKIAASGIVLRGEGQLEDGTTILGTGTLRRTLISVGGQLKIEEMTQTRRKITDAYVPWGTMSFNIESTNGLSVGDNVIVHRPSTAEWIRDLGMDRIDPRAGTKQWKAGEYDLRFERTITAIERNRIVLDAPVVNAMEDKYGGGTVVRFAEEGRVRQVGVERLRLVSEYLKGKENEDEAHVWEGVSIDQARDVWVRNITTVHISHAVGMGAAAKFVTAQDSACIKPVSRIAGGRRYAFNINGQYCLIQRCYSDHSRHACVTGSRVRGPNVFLDCLSDNTHADAGPHHRWAVGILWDNLKGGPFAVQDRGSSGTGHGWSGAQQVFWNCDTDEIIVQQPPTAQNYAFGCTGKIAKGRFPDRTLGHIESHGVRVTPRSLYLQQLQDRLGRQAVENVTTEPQRTGAVYAQLRAQLGQ